MIVPINLNRDGQISYNKLHKMMIEVINNNIKSLSMYIKSDLMANNNININGISCKQIGNKIKSTITEGNTDNTNVDNNNKMGKKRNINFFIFNLKNKKE